jgi:hypothetical protein
VIECHFNDHAFQAYRQARYKKTAPSFAASLVAAVIWLR